MKEKFPQPVSPEQAEKDKFWADEIAQHAKEYPEFAKRSEKEKFEALTNNLPLWLPDPGIKGSSYGARSTPEKVVEYKAQEGAPMLMADIAAYVEEHGLMDRIRAIAQQQATNSAIMAEMVQNRDMSLVSKIDKTISENEIMELKKDLYFAMRKKGHSGKLLRT